MMKILLTGVTGFIGSYCAEQWHKAGIEVIGIARNKQHVPQAFPYRVYLQDLAAGVPLDEPVDCIVHAAAVSPQPQVTARDFIHSNVATMGPLLEYARKFGVRRCVFLSSLSLYGQVQEPVIDENTGRINPDMYGTTKYLGEQVLAEEKGWLSSMALRLPGVVGAYTENPWIARIAVRLLRQETVEVYNPDALFNNVVHTADLDLFIRSFFARQWQGAECACLGSAEPMTVMQTVQLLKERLQSQSAIVVKPSPAVSFTISIQKACSLGYDPMTTREIIERFAATVRNSRPAAAGSPK